MIRNAIYSDLILALCRCIETHMVCATKNAFKQLFIHTVLEIEPHRHGISCAFITPRNVVDI